MHQRIVRSILLAILSFPFLTFSFLFNYVALNEINFRCNVVLLARYTEETCYVSTIKWKRGLARGLIRDDGSPVVIQVFAIEAIKCVIIQNRTCLPSTPPQIHSTRTAKQITVVRCTELCRRLVNRHWKLRRSDDSVRQRSRVTRDDIHMKSVWIKV